ncbi:MAG: hypothetical protein ACHQ7N_18105 [Candidatus Methylomirabilales bacterium]
MHPHTLPVRVLKNPTRVRLATVLQRDADLVNRHWPDRGMHPFVPEDLFGPAGHLQRHVGSGADPDGSAKRDAAIAVAWWTHPSGARSVRSVSSWGVSHRRPRLLRYRTLSSWATVVPDRYEQLRVRRAERLTRLIARHGQPSSDLQSPLDLLGYDRPTLSATAPGGLLLANDLRDPRLAFLMLSEVIGTCRAHRIPAKCVNPTTAFYRRFPTGAARVQAAITWLFPRLLACEQQP